MSRDKMRAVLAAAIWACAVCACALVIIASERGLAHGGGAPVALSAFFPGDDYSSDMRDEEQVGPLEDPSIGGGEYSAMGDGDDDDAIQAGGDNPAMDHVATGRVFEVQRQGMLDPQHTKHRNYEFPVFRR